MAHIEIRRPDGNKVTYVIPRSMNSDRVSKAMAESKEAGESRLWRLPNSEKRFILDMLQEELEFRTAWEMSEARRAVEAARAEPTTAENSTAGVVKLADE